ncbi:MAG: isochorismatase family protein [Phycisphaerae bacterium]|nr:isochorismatase family protein [Phycisphaerae bacterium]
MFQSDARSIEASSSVLVVIDVQKKMTAAINSDPPEEIIARIEKLVRAAAILEIPILCTEQYPAGLGETDDGLRSTLATAGARRDPIIKNTCSCWRDETFRLALQQSGREHVILAGMETHVCIQQTALDLLRVDYATFIAADACGSRRLRDATIALNRMASAGAAVTSTESIIFEWIERCDHPRFKDIIKLVK